jgi:hypothetical protein
MKKYFAIHTVRISPLPPCVFKKNSALSAGEGLGEGNFQPSPKPSPAVISVFFLKTRGGKRAYSC